MLEIMVLHLYVVCARLFNKPETTNPKSEVRGSVYSILEFQIINCSLYFVHLEIVTTSQLMLLQLRKTTQRFFEPSARQ